MATIIAFPSASSQHDFEQVTCDSLPPDHIAAFEHEALDQLLATAFDEKQRIERRLDVAGLIALAHGSPELRQRMLPLLADAQPATRRVAAMCLGFENNLGAVFSLVALLDDPDAGVRRSAVLALAGIRNPRVLSILLGVLDRDSDLVPVVLTALRLFDPQRIEPIVRPFLDSPDPELALLALGAYLFIDAATSLEIASRFLNHADARHRGLAVSIIERHGNRTCIERLMPLRIDPNARVRSLVADTIAELRRS